MIAIDWDSATVTVTVPVHHTATTDTQKVELSLKAFAGLLLTQCPKEWFAQPPTSGDLPLAVLPTQD